MRYLLWQGLTESAARFPSRPAVSSGSTVLSYREIEEDSTRVARLLSKSRIGPGSRVGILMPKGPRAIVAMLGILKAGAAYVPVDPNAPPRRAAFILGDCAVEGLVTTSHKLAPLANALPDHGSLRAVLLADEAGEALPAPDSLPVRTFSWKQLGELDTHGWIPVPSLETDPAYLLYTSGSTGNPKGVILSHRHALTFVEWAAETFRICPEDRLSNHAPLHFDLSVFDIYAALHCGACVVLVPDHVAPFPVELARWIDQESITVWYSVPSALTRLLLHGQLENCEFERLRTVLFAGEVFPVKYLREVMARIRNAEFVNLYGPTETNVCTYYRVPRPLPLELEAVPIGMACGNTEVLVLDDTGLPIAPGDIGELYVRGPTIMSGYWGLPERTSAALVKNPLQPAYEERLYRTGDLVRLEADGCYGFVGRRDHMVKSRGYRIELGEVEQVFYQNESVKEAIVFAVSDDEVGCRLRAVVVPHAGRRLTRAELQAFCLARLPRYMVPETIVFREELPRTSTGKTDRMAVTLELTPNEQGVLG